MNDEDLLLHSCGTFNPKECISSKELAEELMKVKLYVVTAVDPGGYDSWDVSYHLTRKGALKYIMDRKYESWEYLRYIKPNSYDDDHYYITEKELYD